MEGLNLIFWGLIAGGVIYYLYVSMQEYLKQPKTEEDSSLLPIIDAEIDNSLFDEYPKAYLYTNEYAIMCEILGNLAKSSDAKRSDRFAQVFKNSLIKALGSELDGRYMDESKEIEKELDALYTDPINTSLEDLAYRYKDATAGEYYKRTKLIEIMFALSYTDGVLNEGEKESIIDTAAILEIDNDDFNAMYDSFEVIAKQSFTPKDALEILGIKDAKLPTISASSASMIALDDTKDSAEGSKIDTKDKIEGTTIDNNKIEGSQIDETGTKTEVATITSIDAKADAKDTKEGTLTRKSLDAALDKRLKNMKNIDAAHIGKLAIAYKTLLRLVS